MSVAAYTLRADDINTVYVVNGSEGGFMVLAADDVAPALLGFSDSSMFDPGNMPPQMESWLKLAAIGHLRCAGIAAYASSIIRRYREAISEARKRSADERRISAVAGCSNPMAMPAARSAVS